MRKMIVFFIAPFANRVVQVAIGPQLGRTGAPVLIDRGSKIVVAVSQHLRNRDMVYPTAPRSETVPRSERLPKTS